MAKTLRPEWPSATLNIGVSGHRSSRASFAQNADAIAAALDDVFDLISTTGKAAQPKLLSMLADGADQLAVEGALARKWAVVAPLPFGLALTAALDAYDVKDATTAAALISQEESTSVNDAQRASTAKLIAFAAKTRTFELSEQDEYAHAEWLASFADSARAERFKLWASERYALASRIIVEQSDVLIAVWDGAARTSVGGTGHTVMVALESGVPVVWIDPSAPADWTLVNSVDQLPAVPGADSTAKKGEAARTELTRTIRNALSPLLDRGDKRGSLVGMHGFRAERWKRTNGLFWRGYRIIERAFGRPIFGHKPWRHAKANDVDAEDEPSGLQRPGVVARPTRPEQLEAKDWKTFLPDARALLASDEPFVDAMVVLIGRRFAWADGISTTLSDSYRGGMVLCFFLAMCAVVAVALHVPFTDEASGTVLAWIEAGCIFFILTIAILGQSWRKWHRRWLEIRRAAEYLRHAHILALGGVARPIGRWPAAARGAWPEWYARQCIHELGLPNVAVTKEYLSALLTGPVRAHLRQQRDYHRAKWARLHAVQAWLDAIAGTMFFCAGLMTAAELTILKMVIQMSPATSQWAIFIGILFPTVATFFASVRYFGDFERFAGISFVAFSKLHGVDQLVERFHASEIATDYAAASRILHQLDDIVIAELESWQSVFSAKPMSIPG